MPARRAPAIPSGDNGGRGGPSPATIAPLSPRQDSVGKSPSLLALSGRLWGWGAVAGPGEGERSPPCRCLPWRCWPTCLLPWLRVKPSFSGTACAPNLGWESGPGRAGWPRMASSSSSSLLRAAAVPASSRLCNHRLLPPWRERGLAPHSLHGGLHWRLWDTGCWGHGGCTGDPPAALGGWGSPRPPCDFRGPRGWALPGPGSHF